MNMWELQDMIKAVRDAGRHYAANLNTDKSERAIKRAAEITVKAIPQNQRRGYKARLLDEFIIGATEKQ